MVKDEVVKMVREFVLSSKIGDFQVNDDTMLFKEGFYDSMRFISLIAFLEENFKINLGDNELMEENFESIDAITNFILLKTIK